MTHVILAANTDWYLHQFRASLAVFLQENGFDVTLVSPPGRYVPQLQGRGLRWLPWQVGRQSVSPWSEFASLRQLEDIYRRERPDLAHHHTVKPALYGSVAAQRQGVACVVNSIPGRGFVFENRSLKARLLRPGVGALYRRAFKHPRAAAIFENSADRQFFIEQGFVDAAHTWLIAGVGVDADRYEPSPEPSGAPLVILPGRMLRDKGVEVFIQAARLLRGGGDARFALVGEPDPGNPSSLDPAQIQAWVDEGVVEWWGWQDDMRMVYARSHIVAVPTMYGEGVPTVLLEAAASGRPVIASDQPGCREFVTHGINGWIVPAGEAQALAEAVSNLIADQELRRRMGAAGREIVLSRFTTAHVHQATLDVYHRLLGDGKSLTGE